VGCSSVPIEKNFSALTGSLGFRSGLEDARDIKPDIDTEHARMVFRSLVVPRFGLHFTMDWDSTLVSCVRTES
jgi:hypothetical protein